MKLFAKYNRINVFSTIIIFLLGCIAFSVLLRYVIINQVDEDLRIEKNEIVTYVNEHDSLPSVIEVHDQYTKYTVVEKQTLKKDKIFTRESYNSFEKENELLRTIQFNINTKNKWYLISVSKSLEGTDDLIQTIIAITVILILLILVVTFIINRIVLRRLWQPFYETLQAMQQFNLSNNQTLYFNEPDIDEFKYLNSILKDALNKAQQDYQTLKEFTENASHELQTPIAVVQSKLDILIQNEKLSEAESEEIQSAYTALQGLAKLNQSLLLLAKIENNQFNEITTIDLKESLQNKINQFNDLWENRKLSVRYNLTSAAIKANKYLLEILLNNLLSNATKHNTEHGLILINLDNNLQVTNTGSTETLNENSLYKRFSKTNESLQNHGLGLSIVSQICQVSALHCAYNFQKPNLHTFTISWQ